MPKPRRGTLSKAEAQAARVAENEANKEKQDRWAEYAKEHRTSGQERQAPCFDVEDDG